MALLVEVLNPSAAFVRFEEISVTPSAEVGDDTLAWYEGEMDAETEPLDHEEEEPGESESEIQLQSSYGAVPSASPVLPALCRGSLISRSLCLTAPTEYLNPIFHPPDARAHA